jgi:hypothetical protein
LIGAAVVTSKSSSGNSILGCYWISFLVLILGVALTTSSSGQASGVMTALLVSPLVQLGASVVTLVWITIRAAEPADRKAQMRTLGRITLWAFLWALVGLGLMIVGFFMLMNRL